MLKPLFDTSSDSLPTMPCRRALMLPVVFACLVLTSCGGSNSSLSAAAALDANGVAQDDTPDAGVVGEMNGAIADLPDALQDEDSISLTFDYNVRCSTVGESFSLGITRSLTEEEQNNGALGERQDASAYVKLTQSFGDSLELLSRGDGAVQLQLLNQDIVGLTAELDSGPNSSSVTAYLAGFASDAPETVILKKPVPGGCLYALRQTDSCATGIAKGGTFTIGTADQGISAMGCELDNPAEYPVIELDASR